HWLLGELAHGLGLFQISLGDGEMDRDSGHHDLCAAFPITVGQKNTGDFKGRRPLGASESGLSSIPVAIYVVWHRPDRPPCPALRYFDIEAVDEAGPTKFKAQSG